MMRPAFSNHHSQEENMKNIKITAEKAVRIMAQEARISLIEARYELKSAPLGCVLVLKTCAKLYKAPLGHARARYFLAGYAANGSDLAPYQDAPQP